VNALNGLIEQHSKAFYRRDALSTPFLTQELDNPKTRQAAIRRFIVETIIVSIITKNRYLFLLV
jgi:hypothetical protein